VADALKKAFGSDLDVAAKSKVEEALA